MNITFDKALKQRIWQTVNSKAKNDECPFCTKKITAKNFVGCALVDGEFRVFDGNLMCLIQLSDVLKEQNFENPIS